MFSSACGNPLAGVLVSYSITKGDGKSYQLLFSNVFVKWLSWFLWIFC